MPDDPTWIVKINAPADKVWPLVSDLGRHAEWSTRPYPRKPIAMRQITVCEPMTRFEVVSTDPGTSATTRSAGPGSGVVPDPGTG